jgi:hypothetical protein
MYQLRRGMEVDVTVSYVDDLGEQAQVEGDPVWTSADPAALTVKNTTDPFMVTIQALGAIGALVTLTVEADADLGEGIVPVIATEEISIVSGQATTAAFGFGEPRPIAAE